VTTGQMVVDQVVRHPWLQPQEAVELLDAAEDHQGLIQSTHWAALVGYLGDGQEPEGIVAAVLLNDLQAVHGFIMAECRHLETTGERATHRRSVYMDVDGIVQFLNLVAPPWAWGTQVRVAGWLAGWHKREEPRWMQEVKRYLEEHKEPPEWLYRVLTNDFLMVAMELEDQVDLAGEVDPSISLEVMRQELWIKANEVVIWMMNAPEESWGSREKVDKWLEGSAGYPKG